MRRTRIFSRAKAFGGDRRGGAALEFALVAPSLAFALAVTVDLGLAYNEQMTLDHAVRAGAEFAATGVADKDTLEKLVIAAAIGHVGEAPYEVRKAAPAVEVIEVCRCPGQETEVACTTTCPGLTRPSLFYTLEARKTYDALFFADRELGAAIQVQVR
ncbi:TadE/TadG family type IV pilus assembly protein [Amphiplicatus metriothermophilus]|uniref:TadE-like protein n=1 Tax=Amphiplicatus metriothermophilus TaxID=1519374 RepID=A0A239PJR3_9PROT|nr:TadE/TadG family type IV pilus assembly protein [Amphiplicatus metriothermophilus]MBB5517618.1 hypothetical protein [Amphiplicatus metriothermophilus]SNT68048.1 TadE-like protein [Amphiplicatus metriothermophilus]